MSQNQEIKFITNQAHVPNELLRQVEFTTERIVNQEDWYSFSSSQFFKLRINDGVPTRLLRYNRLTSPVLRESHYEAYDLTDKSSQSAARFIFNNISLAGIVRKRRRQLEAPNLLLNIDTIYADEWQRELYHVVEIECFSNRSSAQEIANTVQIILSRFDVRPFELLPYSNIHMINMLKRSEGIRCNLQQPLKGKLILIDGGSGTGKSTIKKLLLEKYQMRYARRDTTRAPRPDDFATNDYRFVSRAEFDQNALIGNYIEFRDFLFGMSYGLRWDEFITSLSQGQDTMALINLGNGYFTKKLFPEATLVLLYANVDTIRDRLYSRGGMTAEQIEERVENNQLAVTYIDAYDIAIDTSEFTPEEVAEKIISPAI